MNAQLNHPVADDPNELPYPGFAREKAALDAKVAAATRAASAPLPGPLREAFAGEAPVLHGFTLQPVTMGLHPLLVKLGSPLLDIVRIMREELGSQEGDAALTPEAASAARAERLQKAQARILTEITADEEALVETVFCFVTATTELRQILAKGRDTFREVAMRTIGDRLHPAQFAELQQAVSAHYAASFATAIQHEAAKGKDDGTVFTAPPAKPMTASAGGSTSSAP